jgi:hypothetical protein
MASQPGRVVNSWNFPEGQLMKAIIGALHIKRGLRGNELVAAFVSLIPHWADYFAKPISENAVAQRADKMNRYPSENPRTNERTRVYWGKAVRVVRDGERLGKRDVRRLVAS